MRQLTEFETKVLLAVGLTRYNTPGDIAYRISKGGNSGAIVVNQALQRLEGRGLVTYSCESNNGGTNRTNAAPRGWELTTSGADECQLFARMGRKT